jgi:hypothetical protein
MRKAERPIAKKVHTKLKPKAEIIPNLPPHSVTISRSSHYNSEVSPFHTAKN